MTAPDPETVNATLRRLAELIQTHVSPETPASPPPLKPGSRSRLPRRFSLGSEKDIARFWSKVMKTGPDACWVWQGACKKKSGYGIFSLEGGNVQPHRYSFQLANDLIPPGMHVLHACDNPPCVNPRHLRLGTSVENARDRVARGRQPAGEYHPLARLNEADVRAIRASDETYAALGRRYGVSPGTIGAIRQRKCWKHLDDGPAVF
jgi:hypothetical protein